MAENSLHCLIVFDHFLVMAAALFMRASSYGLAHHPVQVPLSSVFLAPFNHRFEFDEETHIFFILILTPMRFGVLFARSCLTVL